MEQQIDFRRVPHAHRVELLADVARKRIALDHLETLLLDAMAADPEPYPGDKIACAKEWVREEVAAIHRIAPVMAGKKLHVASRLTARFPAVVDAMQDGLMPGYFATRLVELTDELSDEHAAKVEKRVLPRVGQQTCGRFAASIRRAVLAVDPRTAVQKHERSRHDRRVVFTPPGDDGMGEVYAYLPADLLVELKVRVGAFAREGKKLRDGRTMNQLRADARWLPSPGSKSGGSYGIDTHGDCHGLLSARRSSGCSGGRSAIGRCRAAGSVPAPGRVPPRSVCRLRESATTSHP